MSTHPATSLALWVTLASTALTAALVARWYGRWKNNRPPVKWRRVGELLELTLYPLKSGRGIDLGEADCAELGLRTTDKKPLVLRDSPGYTTTCLTSHNRRECTMLCRFFLAYNASSGEFVTARGHPKMVLIQVVPREDGDVTFLAPGMSELRVRLPTEGSAVEKRECTRMKPDLILSVSRRTKWWAHLILFVSVGKKRNTGLQQNRLQRREPIAFYHRLRNCYPSIFILELGSANVTSKNRAEYLCSVGRPRSAVQFSCMHVVTSKATAYALDPEQSSLQALGNIIYSTLEELSIRPDELLNTAKTRNGVDVGQVTRKTRFGIKIHHLYFLYTAANRSYLLLVWCEEAALQSSSGHPKFGAYSDLTSFMLMAESSVTDLRSKLPSHLQDITNKRFRPNLVVGGSDPYQEDTWDWVKIGDSVIFKKCKPCTRCVMTTIDPETGSYGA
uniref:MOSC domain-containing protein n=1 Tax=Timema monikensis TaxID=170555 RepID=A0A7R9EIL1_9NEOP|nr:unnamed protein product [Timema monikensis]